jgi:lipid-A-disaccharide synthase-like uncharacterized protein
MTIDLSLWKVVGFVGAALFAGRWIIQYAASRRAGRSVVPTTFWLASISGSALLLLYFSLGPNRDAVGFLGNLLPAMISAYNLALHGRQRRGQRAAPAPCATPPGAG